VSATSDNDFLQRLSAQRYSCRNYAPEQPVPIELLHNCIKAARLAPSACNKQPWRFIIIQSAEKRQALFTQARLPGISHNWWQQVPVFVALCVDLDLVTHRLAPALSGLPYYFIDAGIAGEHFVLAATAQGLATCWIGWFRERAVKRICAIPRRVRVVALITVGYAETPAPPARPRRQTDAVMAHEQWPQQWNKKS